MEASTSKKRKLRENSITSVFSLDEICELRESKAIAIKYLQPDGSSINIDYAQLCAARSVICNVLRDAESSQFVGITSDIPAFCFPALALGIMSSDRAFVYLPPSTHETRRICAKLNISHILALSRPSDAEIVQSFVVHEEETFLVRSKEGAVDSEESSQAGARRGLFAYATTTSGSTGRPKIVKVTHASIIPNILDLKKKLDMSARDKVAQITPLTFDPSIIEVFLSLSCEGTLLVASENLKNRPEALLKILVRNGVTFIQSTPSLLLQRWSSEELKESLLRKDAELRILLLGGEDFPNEKVLSRIRASDNETRIFDVYGITEVSCWASISEIQRGSSTRGLGETLSETILQVRNDEGQEVVEGEGTLYIGSNSRICALDDEDIGLLRRPVFRDTGDIVEIDQNGHIDFKGRRGRRVKRYGTKLYLKDLESHVEQLPFVQDSYALFDDSNQSLHLFFTTIHKSADASEKIKHENDVFNLTKELSAIKRPDTVTMLDRFELTSNGKIREDFLKNTSAKLSKAAADNQRDSSKPTEVFQSIWKRWLTFDQVLGFFDSGGSSVLALRIANELNEKTHREFPKLLGLLLRNENLSACREYISSEISEFSGNGEKSPSDETHESFERFFAERSDEIRKGGDELGKILPWQKCRGRSNFPVSPESDLKKEGSKFIIRPELRYDLEKCVDASPTIFKYPGGKSYVSVGSHAGIICTAELNVEYWGDQWEVSLPDRIEASILVIHDFRGIVGSYDTFVYCFDLRHGEIFWKFKTDDIVKCTAVLSSSKENIFFGSYDRRAYCVSLKDGSEVWRVKAGNGSVYATPCVNDELNCVLFATLDGTCVSLNQSNGEINWSIKSDYPVFSGPEILGTESAVFCDVSGNLRFVSTVTGEKILQEKIDGNVFSHLCVNTNDEKNLHSLVFASESRNVYKIEYSLEEKSVLRFTSGMNAPIASTPFSDGKIIIVASNDGNLTVLDSTNGEKLCSVKLEGDVFSSPLIHENFAVVGCRDNHLYVLLILDQSE